ncbi:MAG: hypothetical protein JST55_08485 [Bacteroidetes bacterium]|nr:hypothetical protein [Bacteroidota bacterium]
MKNTRIAEILKTFTEKELKGFGDFVSSKYFNQSDKIVKLFEILSKYYPDFEGDELEKEKVFVKLFGKKKYEDEKMRTLISNLMKLCKKYLIQLDIESNASRTNLHLLNQLKDRGQKSLFDYEYNKLNSALEQNCYKEREYFFVKYYMEQEMYYSNPTSINDNYLQQPLIEKVSNNFEILFLIDALEINYNKLTRKSKVNYNPEFIFLDVIKSKIENGDYSEIPIIPLKYYIFMCVQNPMQEEYYAQAEKIFYDNLERISPHEKPYINTGLINYCWLRVGTGDVKYFRKVFEMYKIGLEEGIYFYENKYLLNSLFNGIVKCACYLKEYKWLFQFIHEYKNKIDPEHRKEIVNVAYSKYYFEIKDFDTALKHVNKINPTNSLLKLEIKVLTIKILYELNYLESVYSSIDSLKHFFRNNKLLHPGTIEQGYACSKAFKKLCDLKIKKDKKELEFFRKSINESNELGMINTRWITEKIDEILK